MKILFLPPSALVGIAKTLGKLPGFVLLVIAGYMQLMISTFATIRALMHCAIAAFFGLLGLLFVIRLLWALTNVVFHPWLN